MTVCSELLRWNVDGADSPDAVPAWARQEAEIRECRSAFLKGCTFKNESSSETISGWVAG